MQDTLSPLSLLVLLLLVFSHRVHAHQFHHWYPYYRYAITIDNNQQQCFETQLPLSRWNGVNDGIDHCKFFVNCVQGNLGEIDKADMASATILLGLLPGLVSVLGLGLEEGAEGMVGRRRKRMGDSGGGEGEGESGSWLARWDWMRAVVAVLCAVSAPSVRLSEPLILVGGRREGMKQEEGSQVRQDTQQRVEEGASKDWSVYGQTQANNTTPVSTQVFPSVHTMLGRRSWLPLTVDLLLVSAAAANVLELVITLGNQTVTSWKCRWSVMPLIWLGLLAAPRLAAVLAALLMPRHIKAGKVVFAFAKVLAYMHQIFGLLVFSSCLFIGTLDALGVLVRFGVSAIVGRMVFLLEVERADARELGNS